MCDHCLYGVFAIVCFLVTLGYTLARMITSINEQTYALNSVYQFATIVAILMSVMHVSFINEFRQRLKVNGDANVAKTKSYMKTIVTFSPSFKLILLLVVLRAILVAVDATKTDAAIVATTALCLEDVLMLFSLAGIASVEYDRATAWYFNAYCVSVLGRQATQVILFFTFIVLLLTFTPEKNVLLLDAAQLLFFALNVLVRLELMSVVIEQWIKPSVNALRNMRPPSSIPLPGGVPLVPVQNV